jgi:LacI family transcriptional regulator
MRPSRRPTSLANIAKAAGVSTAAVSFALHGKPGISAKTREHILAIAGKLGYAPDARIAGWMARVRDAKAKELLPIAWLNTAWQKDAWEAYPFHTPYLEGARARARELGYSVENIWMHEPGMSMQRLAKILYERGIEGVIVTHPARHVRLKWDHLAAVTMGGSLVAPQLHRVTSDLNYNLLLALKTLRRLGYRRVGVCFPAEYDSAWQHALSAIADTHYAHAPAAERVRPLILPLLHHEQWAFHEALREAEVVAWLRKERPEAVICHDGRFKQWAAAAGLKVPEDLAIVHLARDDDVLDWAGIHSRRREIGATAVEWLVSLMRNHQFGVPKTPLTILVRGAWRMGKTLRSLR